MRRPYIWLLMNSSLLSTWDRASNVSCFIRAGPIILYTTASSSKTSSSYFSKQMVQKKRVRECGGDPSIINGRTDLLDHIIFVFLGQILSKVLTELLKFWSNVFWFGFGVSWWGVDRYVLIKDTHTHTHKREGGRRENLFQSFWISQWQLLADEEDQSFSLGCYCYCYCCCCCGGGKGKEKEMVEYFYSFFFFEVRSFVVSTLLSVSGLILCRNTTVTTAISFWHMTRLRCGDLIMMEADIEIL